MDQFYPSLTDPPGASTLTAAVAWVQGTLLGTVAITVAIIAIASVGFGMLTGRIDLRRGITVVIGCFVLFGASSLAQGIRSAEAVGEPTIEPPPPPVTRPPAMAPVRSSAFDPYAGSPARAAQ